MKTYAKLLSVCLLCLAAFAPCAFSQMTPQARTAHLLAHELLKTSGAPATPGMAAKLEAALKTAVAHPELAELLKAQVAARAAYLEDNKKFPGDKNPAIKRAYTAATKRAKAALLEADPALGPALNPSVNEGERLADAGVRENPAMAPVRDVAGLPRVLLIGDSISIGYTPTVRAALKGVANVHRIRQNGGATEVGLANIDAWLNDESRYGKGTWDVIHFNFGLHDAKYKTATELRATRERYLENLKTLIDKMKATGATLIFATTTPLPDKIENPGRRFDSIEARNALAKKLMEENGVVVEDLYALVLPRKNAIQRPGDVHFSPEGSRLIGEEVAKNIKAALETRAKK